MDGRREDSWRDALAILAAILREDLGHVGLLLRLSDRETVTAAFASMLFEQLRRSGENPQEWVAAEQARSVGELAW